MDLNLLAIWYRQIQTENVVIPVPEKASVYLKAGNGKA